MMPFQMTPLAERDLIARFRSFEDSFVERKSAKEQRDCLKTAVAFANTLPTGVPGVLFIPATNDGKIQRDVNLDELQRDISRYIERAYPPLFYFPQIVTIDGEPILAIQIPGSPDRPHFAGPAYVRVGSESKNASADQFQQLIDRRSSKVEELTKWIGKVITANIISPGTGPRIENKVWVELVECTKWYITIKYQRAGEAKILESVALRRVEISFDQENYRLSVDIYRG